jgi:hypothetical protein
MKAEKPLIDFPEKSFTSNMLLIISVIAILFVSGCSSNHNMDYIMHRTFYCSELLNISFDTQSIDNHSSYDSQNDCCLCYNNITIKFGERGYCCGGGFP